MALAIAAALEGDFEKAVVLADSGASLAAKRDDPLARRELDAFVDHLRERRMITAAPRLFSVR